MANRRAQGSLREATAQLLTIVAKNMGPGLPILPGCQERETRSSGFHLQSPWFNISFGFKFLEEIYRPSKQYQVWPMSPLLYG